MSGLLKQANIYGSVMGSMVTLMRNRLKSQTASRKFLGYDQDFEVEVLSILFMAWAMLAALIFWLPNLT